MVFQPCLRAPSRPEEAVFSCSWRSQRAQCPARPAPSRHGSVAARAAEPSSSQPSDREPEAQQSMQNNWDGAFAPLADALPLPLSADWRAFRADLVERERTARLPFPMPLGDDWAHPLAAPERGCLLVAKERHLGMFSYAVVLLLEHDDAQGSSGLAINIPTPLAIRSLGLEEHITDAFGRSTLHLGGPVTRHLLHVLHGRRGVEGAVEVVEGVYAGGIEDATALVRSGAAAPQEFHLMAGYTGWAPWQLAQEMRDGVWWAVAASPATTLRCIHGGATHWGAQHEGPATRAGLDTRRRCWEELLQAAGVDYRALGL